MHRPTGRLLLASAAATALAALSLGPALAAMPRAAALSRAPQHAAVALLRPHGASVAPYHVQLSAGLVLGQPGFTTPTCNNPTLTLPQRLCHPVGVAIDNRNGRLFVGDGDNNRIMIWPRVASLTNGQPASAVLGKPGFTIDKTCRRVTARTVCDSNSLTVDTAGNLYVADTDGNRVLRFSPPFTTGMAATLVIGQSDFTHHACAASAVRLCAPRDVALDRRGNLYVVDADNNRVLIFKAPLTAGMAASKVIGQSTFQDKACNRGGAPGADTLCGPKGLALDGQGNLYVAEDDNNRVLQYRAPLASTTPTIAATLVFGQPNFTAHACAVGRSRLCGPSRVTVGPAGQVLVSDSGNNRVLVFADPLHRTIPTQVIGQPTATAHAAATTAAGFAGPQGITVDAHGQLYVTDEDNNRVVRYSAVP